MIFATLLNPYWNSNLFRKNVSWEENGSKFFSKEDALSDYDFMMKYLKKLHPLTIDGLPANLEKRALEVREWIEGQEQIEGYILARQLESILSLLGDGHTLVEENYDEYHIMKHVYEHNKAGDTLVGIGGVRFEDFLAQNPTIDSYETVSYGIRMIKNRVVNLEGLKYLGVDTSGEIMYNYLSEEGKEITEVVRAEDFLVMEEYLAYEEAVTGDDLHSEQDRGFVFIDIDEEHSLAILTLNNCSYNASAWQLFDQISRTYGQYGQVVHFGLPKTGFYMQISMKKWYRVDMTKNEEPLYPDITCPEEKALEVLLDSL